MRNYIYTILTTLLLAVNANAQNASEYQLSSHILDISAGHPAQNVQIELMKYDNQQSTWQKIDERTTDKNGRITDFLPLTQNNNGIYKLKFLTKPYFDNLGQNSIYPFIEVVFEIEGNGHYHIPITVSANGYATYRGN